MAFWVGLAIGWLTAGPLVVFVLILLSVGRDD